MTNRRWLAAHWVSGVIQMHDSTLFNGSNIYVESELIEAIDEAKDTDTFAAITTMLAATYEVDDIIERLIKSQH